MKSMRLGVYELNGKDVFMIPGEVEDMVMRTRLPVPVLPGPNARFSQAVGHVVGIWPSGDSLMVDAQMAEEPAGRVPVPSIIFNRHGQQQAFAYFFLAEDPQEPKGE
jgi:hypothetical protein